MVENSYKILPDGFDPNQNKFNRTFHDKSEKTHYCNNNNHQK